MSGVLVLSGAGIFDQSFTLDASEWFPEISWNSTRIEHDAFRGVFGPPEKIRMSELAKWSYPEDNWKNIDRKKVYRFIEAASTPVVRANWRLLGKPATIDGPCPTVLYRLLDVPVIFLMLRLSPGGVACF